MVHTFEEIRTAPPPTPTRLPQRPPCRRRHEEPSSGTRSRASAPPYTRKTLRRWLQTTHPRAWAIGAPQPPPPPQDHHIGEGKGTGKRRARDGKGRPGEGARRGPR